MKGFYKASMAEKDAGSRMINLDEVAHCYTEMIAEKTYYMVALKTGPILPVSKEAYEDIEAKLIA